MKVEVAIPTITVEVISEKVLGYRVEHQSQCRACEGSGVVQHPLWKEFYDMDPPPEPQDYEARAQEMGYAGVKDMPEEEMTCPDCQGLGYVRREARLVDALKELGLL
jgi:DnaJ-class molecular chaperone